MIIFYMFGKNFIVTKTLITLCTVFAVNGFHVIFELFHGVELDFTHCAGICVCSLVVICHVYI